MFPVFLSVPQALCSGDMKQVAWKASRRFSPFDTRGTCPQNVRGVRFVPGASAVPNPYTWGHQFGRKSSDSFHHLLVHLHTQHCSTHTTCRNMHPYIHTYTRSKYTLRCNTHLHVTNVRNTQRHHHMLRHTCTHIDTCVSIHKLISSCLHTHTYTNTHS